MSRKVAHYSFLQIFEVHQFPAIAIFFEQFHGVAAAVQHPQNIHFKRYVCGIGVLNNIVQKRSFFVGAKLKTVGMIAKNQAVLFQYFTRVVENRHGSFGIFEGEVVAFVRNPSAHYKRCTQ